MPIDLLPHIPNAIGLIEPGTAAYTPGPQDNTSIGELEDGKIKVLPANVVYDPNNSNQPHLGVFDNGPNAANYVTKMNTSSAAARRSDMKALQADISRIEAKPANSTESESSGGGAPALTQQGGGGGVPVHGSGADETEGTGTGAYLTPKASWIRMMDAIGQSDHNNPQGGTY